MSIHCKLLNYKFINFYLNLFFKTYLILKLVEHVFYNNVVLY